MLRLALKMLYGDVAKFVMLLGGLTFCALLMTQQSGVFCGLMRHQQRAKREAAEKHDELRHITVEHL